MTARGKRSGSLQDGAIVPSDLLISQKDTPILIHPMLHPNIGSPRDAATLGEIGSAFAATHVSPLQSVFICFSHLPSLGRGGGGVGGSALLLPIRFHLLVFFPLDIWKSGGGGLPYEKARNTRQKI